MGFLIFGAVLLLIGILFIFGEIFDYASCSQSVTAQVVKLEKDHTSYWKGTYQYHPIFRYVVNGQEYTLTDKYSPTRNTKKFRPGSYVTLKYNPAKPENFRTGAKISSFIIGIILIAAGAALAVCYFL